MTSRGRSCEYSCSGGYMGWPAPRCLPRTSYTGSGGTAPMIQAPPRSFFPPRPSAPCNNAFGPSQQPNCGERPVWGYDEGEPARAFTGAL